MQKLCCVHTRQHPLPVWSHKFVLSSTTHISTNSHPFLVGIVSDIQDTSAPWKMVRTPRTDKAQARNYLRRLELILPLFLLQPSSKLRKTLISIWRIRILGFQYYESIPLLTYWVMTLLVTLALP